MLYAIRNKQGQYFHAKLFVDQQGNCQSFCWVDGKTTAWTTTNRKHCQRVIDANKLPAEIVNY